MDWKPQAPGIYESQAENLIAELEQKIADTVDEVEPHEPDPEVAVPVARNFEPTDTDSEEMTLEPAAGTESARRAAQEAARLVCDHHRAKMQFVIPQSIRRLFPITGSKLTGWWLHGPL